MLKFLIAAILLLEYLGNPAGTALAHLLMAFAIVVLALRLPRLLGDLLSPARRI